MEAEGAVEEGAEPQSRSPAGPVEDTEEEESPSEATHLAVTFRLTEAYTGAEGGRALTTPAPLPGTQASV